MSMTRLALLFGLSVPFFAAGQQVPLAERFDRADRNGDGRVTPDELPRREIFARLDRNGDGVIRKEELARRNPPERESGENGAVPDHADLAYGEHERHRLDLYLPAEVNDSPVMIYVHGGGWRKGDKSRVGMKASYFTGREWIFVSVNYRLLPEGAHPANVNDVARAIGWIHDQATEFGGDPEKVFLMGHSAGAHLAALVATSEAPLREVGKSPSVIRGVIPLDTNAYELPRLMESGGGFYGQVFGDDPELWRDASPVTHVAPEKGIPPFLVCYSRGMGARPNPERPVRAEAFAEALRSAGVPVEVIDASDRNHGEINLWFGRDEDETVTGAAERFLDEILARGDNGNAEEAGSSSP